MHPNKTHDTPSSVHSHSHDTGLIPIKRTRFAGRDVPTHSTLPTGFGREPQLSKVCINPAVGFVLQVRVVRGDIPSKIVQVLCKRGWGRER